MVEKKYTRLLFFQSLEWAKVCSLFSKSKYVRIKPANIHLVKIAISLRRTNVYLYYRKKKTFLIHKTRIDILVVKSAIIKEPTTTAARLSKGGRTTKKLLEGLKRELHST